MKGSFDDIINTDLPVLIDFSAEWCGPCKMQGPILKEVVADMPGKVKVLKIDVDKNPQLAARYQIRSVPTLMIFKNGQSIWRGAGVHQKNQLVQLINQYQ